MVGKVVNSGIVLIFQIIIFYYYVNEINSSLQYEKNNAVSFLFFLKLQVGRWQEGGFMEGGTDSGRVQILAESA